ncbi:hypothetical protein [Polyangium aurulentum]|uniref:hypothetical protein n=1 Tax=Polyangium aurulentum TaxID=2567896 RepID=UPI0010AEB04F|nr:hypothetical protein [Polyangium aurulentum]UQA59704.1 hypothetical protein E8A73_004145 [Polyangium aurulentum]
MIALRMAFLACALLPPLAFVACSRHADIRDEQDGAPLEIPPNFDAGGIPELDSGLGSDAYPLCNDRPIGACVGSNDFLCGFDKWFASVAASCQTSTGCKTNGWLEVKMAEDGCVNYIGMEEPNDEIVACLVAEFGAVRCPCSTVAGSYYFGEDNMGTCPAP